MIRTAQCPDDLISRGLRGTLSAEEEVRLAAHLRICATCRIASLVASDFDILSSVFAGDDQVIARITRRTTARSPQAWRFPFSGPILAAALLGVGAAAAASWHASSQRDPENADGARAHVADVSSPVARVSTQKRSVATIASASPASVAVLAASNAPEETASAAEDSSPRASSKPLTARGRAGNGGTLRGVEDPSHDAKALFSRANGLRQVGEIAQAILAYEALQHRFPGSAEAMLSHVSLGNLLMVRNEVSRALQHFRAYLAVQPRGLLAEEALFGQGRALQRLGHYAEERRAWQALLLAYPKSVYSDTARDRAPQIP